MFSIKICQVLLYYFSFEEVIAEALKITWQIHSKNQEVQKGCVFYVLLQVYFLSIWNLIYFQNNLVRGRKASVNKNDFFKSRNDWKNYF
jgi:hypothetical protein